MEPLILYFVLFFPGVFSSGFPGNITTVETIPFSLVRELGRTLTYTIPALALLWYLMSDKKGFSALEGKKPGKQDFFPFIMGFPGLVLVGLLVSCLVSLVSSYSGLPPPPRVEVPSGFWGWIVIIVSCLGTGYLEESYFRYYLLKKLENPVPPVILRIVFSTVLFSICHVYEGPWGILYAALAGVLLSVLFVRYESLHGIAWAHGAYNVFVYFVGIFQA